MKIRVFPGLLAALLCLAVTASAKNRKGTTAKGPEKPGAKPEATAKPAKDAVPAKSAYVRIWKEDFTTEGDLRARIRPTDAKAEPFEVDLDAKGFRFTNYAAVAAGPTLISVNIPTQSDGPKSPEIAYKFTPGSFTTLIVSRGDDGLRFEILDDAPSGQQEGDAELLVRNFVHDLKDFRVQVGEDLSARLHGPEGFLQVRGLNRKLSAIETTAQSSDGKESKWTTEVDFSSVRRATLLIFADPYGRIRPRVMFDAVAPGSVSAAQE